MGNGVEKYVKNVWPQSDLEMISGSVKDYINSSEPFHAYYMTVSGHLNYNYNDNAMVQKNWDKVKDLHCSDTVKSYYACNIELDLALEALLKKLNQAGVADKTVIAIFSSQLLRFVNYTALFAKKQDLPKESSILPCNAYPYVLQW